MRSSLPRCIRAATSLVPRAILAAARDAFLEMHSWLVDVGFDRSVRMGEKARRRRRSVSPITSVRTGSGDSLGRIARCCMQRITRSLLISPVALMATLGVGACGGFQMPELPGFGAPPGDDDAG